MKLRTAHALISRVCVNNCIFCAVAGKRKAREFPTTEEVFRFIKDSAAAGIRTLTFSGLGEPTLERHFEEYLATSNALGFKRICLFTNGHGLTPEKVTRWKDSGLSEVLLSIHGMEQGHDRNTQREGSFREAISALELYVESGLPVTVNTCLTRLNLAEIPKLTVFLAQHPVKMHTLSFPEWSGNAEVYSEHMVDYEEVATAADQLIRAEDKITFFDNIPYCLVRGKIREMQGVSSVRLLDGGGDRQLHPMDGKLLHESCSERGCPLLGACPGFEKNYISVRGWQNLGDRVNTFLDRARHSGVRCKSLATRSVRPRQQTLDRKEDEKPDEHYHEDSLVVVVKPTSRCNADCVYCASRKPSAMPDLTSDLLRRLYEELFSYADLAGIRKITFLWHGGEPLLLSKSFYADAWEELRKQNGFGIRHLLQTNLLLLDEEWVDLFRRFDVHVSTSVDPIGQDRVYKDGRSQYPDWLERFALACSGNVLTGIVFTAMSAHADRGSDIYNFFKNLQTLSPRPIGIRVNAVHAPRNPAPSLDPAQIIKPVEFGEFLWDLWKLWTSDGRQFAIEPLREFSEPTRQSCESAGRCHEHFLSIDGVGDIFNCGRFADAGLPWGNIVNENLTSILQHPQRLEMFQRRTALREGHCKDCRLWQYCRGGCPYHAYLESGDRLQASPFCQSYKTFFARSGLDVPATSRRKPSNV